MLFQFINFISWIAAEPMANLAKNNIKYEVIPKNAKSFYPNHGEAIFNTHGTPTQEPLIFSFWVLLFMFSLFFLFRFKPPK
jgi:hypothetical protein